MWDVIGCHWCSGVTWRSRANRWRKPVAHRSHSCRSFDECFCQLPTEIQTDSKGEALTDRLPHYFTSLNLVNSFNHVIRYTYLIIWLIPFPLRWDLQRFFFFSFDFFFYFSIWFWFSFLWFGIFSTKKKKSIFQQVF